jgi:hypothetical protein
LRRDRISPAPWAPASDACAIRPRPTRCPPPP